MSTGIRQIRETKLKRLRHIWRERNCETQIMSCVRYLRGADCVQLEELRGKLVADEAACVRVRIVICLIRVTLVIYRIKMSSLGFKQKVEKNI